MIDIDTSIIIESFWKGFSLVFEAIKPFIYLFIFCGNSYSLFH